MLDTDKKTILHIPSVQSGESTKDKLREVDEILDSFGEVEYQDDSTGVIYVKRNLDGKTIKVADLVNDDEVQRRKIVEYLRTMDSLDDMDLIIALGDGQGRELRLALLRARPNRGYRGSLTEIIQIIGRCTT